MVMGTETNFVELLQRTMEDDEEVASARTESEWEFGELKTMGSSF